MLHIEYWLTKDGRKFSNKEDAMKWEESEECGFSFPACVCCPTNPKNGGDGHCVCVISG